MNLRSFMASGKKVEQKHFTAQRNMRAHNDNFDGSGGGHVDENQTTWLGLRGNISLRYALHIHQTGYNMKKAQEIVNRRLPGYIATGFQSSLRRDSQGREGSYIIVKSKI